MSMRLLVVTGKSAASLDDLPAGIRQLLDLADQILVVAPSLPSGLDWLTSDTDKATEQADQRLQSVLGQLEEMGAEAEGTVGADDPLTAFEDAVAQFSPHHILISLRPQERAGWQERDLIDQVIDRFELPVTVFQL